VALVLDTLKTAEDFATLKEPFGHHSPSRRYQIDDLGNAIASEIELVLDKADGLYAQLQVGQRLPTGDRSGAYPP
jgi:hypothetical protein